MAIEITEWAADILNRAQTAAARFDPDARIRLQRTGNSVEAVLTDEPADDDHLVEVGAMTLFVESGLEGLVDCEEPHDRLVLRPHGSTPNPRGEH